MARRTWTLRLTAAAAMLAAAAIALGQAAEKTDKVEKKASKVAKRPVYREDEVLRQLEALWPEFHARLLAAKTSNPKDYQERMDRVGPVVERYIQLKPTNPGLAALLIESFHLGEDCRDIARLYHMAPDDGGRSKLAEQLRAKVAEQVDLEFRRQQAELMDVEKKVEQMRKQLAEQQAKKEKTVEERVKKWVGKTPPKPTATK